MGLLILLRHAKAVRDHDAESDRARDLTQRGRRDAAAAGAAIAAAGLAPTAMLASPAQRTRETAAMVRPLLPVPPEVAFIEALYMADVDDIWRAAHAQIESGVVVVGHNPGLHALAALLVERSGERSALARQVVDNLPTAAWVAFEVDGAPLESTRARLVAGWSPKA